MDGFGCRCDVIYVQVGSVVYLSILPAHANRKCWKINWAQGFINVAASCLTRFVAIFRKSIRS